MKLQILRKTLHKIFQKQHPSSFFEGESLNPIDKIIDSNFPGSISMDNNP